GGQTFSAVYRAYCSAGTSPNCTTLSSEGVAILVSKDYTIKSNDFIYMFQSDAFAAARPALHAEIQLVGGATTIHVFTTHLTPPDSGTSYQTSRINEVAALKQWARGFSSCPSVIGG